MRKLLSFLIIMFALFGLSAQPWHPNDKKLYNSEILPKVYITIHPDTLQWLYDNVESDIEFHATFVFNFNTEFDTVKNVGFRLRGNTSRQSAKKSFKISFNTFEKGRSFKGVEKMNLNGEHNDPTIIRSYLGWHLCEDLKIPGSRINHVDLYINNNYYGLYANVEHIDEEFIQKRYDHKFGNLYKCLWPASLDYLGTDAQTYAENNYILKINEDQFNYSKLIGLTNVISNTASPDYPTALEPIFNVNGFIRYLAFETFTSHWDAYTFNKNNYYLYENQFNNKIEFIPYDLDNIYGIDWFITDLANRDIYNFGEMILTKKVLENQVYRDRYSYFLNQIVSSYANLTSYFPLIDAKRDQIKNSANLDTYRPLDYGWTYEQFLSSYDEALGAHVVYGLKQYISERIASINEQIQLNPIAPIIENIYHNFASLNEAIKVKANIIDDEAGFSAKLHWKLGEGTYAAVNMTNDSLDVFSAVVAAISTPGTFYYYIEATDASGKTTRDPFSGDYTINLSNSTNQLQINEIMASNSTVIYDNYGETDDWIELKNTGVEAIDLGELFISDDINDKSKWRLPNVTLEPNEYYLIWVDKDAEQGDNHANFKLSASGEFLGLFDSFENNYTAIDTLTFGVQTSNVSMGRNESGAWEIQNIATPMGDNGSGTLSYINFHYNMNKQIQDGNFEKGIDFIDIAGTFNNWEGSLKIYDGDADGVHTATLFGFYENQEIQYKARIGADWGTAEFPELGGDGNRLYTLLAGANSVSHWYNDTPLRNALHARQNEFRIYPNPARGSYINIETTKLGSLITIYTLNGQIVYTAKNNTIGRFQIENIFKPGLYIVQLNNEGVIQNRKLIVH